MFKKIRSSKFKKVVACYLTLMILLEMTQPMAAYALTEGPSQPEFNSFTPIGTSDMVDLTSGDFNYNIPIMDVGGYPINLAYNSGVTMDQEASWVGLGWNLNIGQINRNVRGLPDDFNGDEIITENNMKTNLTLGVNPYVNVQLIGYEKDKDGNRIDNTASNIGSLGAGLNIQYNNYRGVSCVPSFGLSFNLSDNVSVGAQLTSSNEEGASITPSVSLHAQITDKDDKNVRFSPSISPSITYNSRQGLQSFNLSSNFAYQRKNDKNIVVAKNNQSFSSGISFVNNTFTPYSRVPYKNDQFTFSFSVGPDAWGGHVELSVAASATIQSLKDKVFSQKAYGYEFTDFADYKSILDFNREKEHSIVTKNTMLLPVTNYTYDILSIQGQTNSGMFRPHRGQIGRVYDPLVTDVSTSTSASLEIEAGAGGHIGGNIKRTVSKTKTGAWNTVATPYFIGKLAGNHITYESTYYKMVGETKSDEEENNKLFEEKLSGKKPITLKLDKVNNDALNSYSVKSNTSSTLSDMAPFNKPIKREKREIRNEAIQKITNQEVDNFGLSSLFSKNTYSKPHHTAGYIITDTNGGRQVYGESAYNISKKEVSFAVDAITGDHKNGLVSYSPNVDNRRDNSKGIDNYFNSVKTPSYAHTYLLTSVFSTDYEDVTQDGASDDDMGSYTKFIYTASGDLGYSKDYHWRVPFEKNEASFNESLRTNKRDQKGSYLYGQKEIKYIKRIETKTHVAFFDLEERKDGFGVKTENGGIADGSPTFKLKSIRLYTKPHAKLLLDNDLSNDRLAIPIKTAHFVYDYSLCKLEKDKQNNNYSDNLTSNEIDNQGGKLTLKKVFFTYRDSNMGRHTPYVFNYDNLNPDYNVKNYDIWGNYMPNQAYNTTTGGLNVDKMTPQEFPYVDQSNKNIQDGFASAWSLSSIDLPSGGKIKIDYETDDYQYVQDKKAMRMFKVDGLTNDPYSYSSNTSNTGYLYGNNIHSDYVVINIGNETASENEVIRKYTQGITNKPIYFNFLMNMTTSSYDYVSGYFEIDKSKPIVSPQATNNIRFLFIPMKKINREGKSESPNENPISVAGWFFGRQNLPYHIYNQPEPSSNIGTNLINLGKSLVSNLAAMKEMLIGPNKRLKDDFGCAQKFIKNKSWIKLLEPDGVKYGGGSRVNKVQMYDNWDKMIGNDNVLSDTDRYQKKYGQEYNYKFDDGTSTGVATYEPNVCKENPLVEPFYNKPEKLTIPTYQEKPFGESFFPAPQVTYSKVLVKNITAADDDGINTEVDPEIRRTKSGVVVTEHYTSKDFPTITDYTDLSKSKDFDTNEDEVVANMLRQLFTKTIDVYSKLTMTQGFYVETNDMNGKLKKQSVYNNNKQLISSVEYKYSVDENDPSVLKNKLPIVKQNGKILETEIATSFDVINDFRESNSNSETIGINPNIDVIPIGVFPLIIGFGVFETAKHRQVLKTAVTTKVVHKTGILKEKIAFDLGSVVSTENLAWDENTGQVIATKTVNEYDDYFYTLNFPAYWSDLYNGMGMATKNLGTEGFLKFVSPGKFKLLGADNSETNNILFIGDELNMISTNHNNALSPTKTKAWVANVVLDQNNNYSIILINSNGVYIDYCGSDNLDYYFKITRSGNRNMQMNSMASITTMTNPIYDQNSELLVELPDFSKEGMKILDASAIQYSDLWNGQSELDLPVYNNNESTGSAASFGDQYPKLLGFNPFLNNLRGEWRANKSWAYLVGRENQNNVSPRKQGFYKDFQYFYKKGDRDAWKIPFMEIDAVKKWTFASEVSQYNPKGVEIENRDALNRYSTAQYGYNYTLPTAVVSNSKYRNMGYEGFEDEQFTNGDASANKRFSFQSSNGENPITKQHSHTGQKSFLVQSGKYASLKVPLSQSSIDDIIRSQFICVNESTGCVIKTYGLGVVSQNICDYIGDYYAHHAQVGITLMINPQQNNLVFTGAIYDPKILNGYNTYENAPSVDYCINLNDNMLGINFTPDSQTGTYEIRFKVETRNTNTNAVSLTPYRLMFTISSCGFNSNQNYYNQCNINYIGSECYSTN